MAKLCSSIKTGRTRSEAAGPQRLTSVWRRRVFRNSFTRRGRTYKVKGWAFRVQFQGRRRTFSLAGRTRAEAAQEAQHLYETIRNQGWQAATLLHSTHRLVHVNKDLAYWGERLVHRRYRQARFAVTPEYSACFEHERAQVILMGASDLNTPQQSTRIEHEGARTYFPLGTNDPELGARKAREIHQTILTMGWAAASKRFERELTLAIAWSDDPLAVTYTTLFTVLGAAPAHSAPIAAADRLRKWIAVVERDATLHSCLRYWLDEQPGFTGTRVFRSAEAVLDALESDHPALILINRMLPEAAQLAEHLKKRRRDLPVFFYRIHDEAGQIFTSISGVTGGYIFRRRLPARLFDPLHAAIHSPSLTASLVKQHIQDYFQSFFRQSEAATESPPSAILTSREQEVLSYASRGHLDKEIADLLTISIWTVNNHLRSIYRKLGVHNRMQAVHEYLEK